MDSEAVADLLAGAMVFLLKVIISALAAMITVWFLSDIRGYPEPSGWEFNLLWLILYVSIRNSGD